MIDVTRFFWIYREIARFIHNKCYLNKLKSDFNFDSVDSLTTINVELFCQLVLDELDLYCQKNEIFVKSIPFFYISLRDDIEVPILVNRPSTDGNMYWDEKIDNVKSEDIKIQFINYFDWDQLSIVDFKYYRGKITSFDRYPKFVGREVLVETEYCKVLLSENRT